MIYRFIFSTPDISFNLSIRARPENMTTDTKQAPPAPDEPDRNDGDWADMAKDEHAANYDPSDPIPEWEADWMARELASTDMTPEEFLRRSK